jgi:hypothetical protein
VLSVINAATSTTSHRTWNEYRNQLVSFTLSVEIICLHLIQESEKSPVTMLRLLYPQRSHNDERIVGCVNKTIAHKTAADLGKVTNLTV